MLTFFIDSNFLFGIFAALSIDVYLIVYNILNFSLVE